MSISEFNSSITRKKYFEEIKQICKEIKKLKKDLEELEGKKSLSKFKKDFEFVERISKKLQDRTECSAGTQNPFKESFFILEKLLSSCSCGLENDKPYSITKFNNKNFMEFLIANYFC